MKKIAFLLTIVALTTLLIGCAVEKVEFQLTEWKVIDDNGTAALQVKFTSTGDVTLRLTDPDGIETDIEFISEGVTGAKLSLAGLWEVPKAGQYKLLATSGELFTFEDVIATETFNFAGAQATISEISLPWNYWMWGYYGLEDIGIKIKNNGDLPAYIYKGGFNVDGKLESLALIDEVVLPGEEKTISYSLLLVTEITPGEKTLSLELKDSADKVVCSYSSTVTPAVAEETQFQFTSWTVTDYLSTATLQLSFTTTGDVDLLLANPDGMETDSDRVYDGIEDSTLDLAGYMEVPGVGQYTLTVKDALGKIIATSTFDFEGAQATISEVSLTWDYWEYLGYYSLESISFKVTNNGDLPVYIDEGKITINSEVDTLSFLYEKVLPSEEKTFEPWVYVSEITSGDKTLNLELKDSAGEVIASYSATVTPSE